MPGRRIVVTTTPTPTTTTNSNKNEGRPADAAVIPDGFPTQLSGPMTWENKDYGKRPEEYISQLDRDDIEQIEDALRHFKGESSFFSFMLLFPV